MGTLGTSTDAQANFINDQGQVVGWSYTSSAPGACGINDLGAGFTLTTGPFIWDKQTGMTDLGGLGGTCTGAFGLNSLGQVVGESNTTGNLEAPQRFFTPDESQRIIDASPEPWNICSAFMADLGVRTSEAVGIAWEHLDLDAGVLLVRQSNWRGKLLTVKSKSSRRDLPIPPILLDMLKVYQKRWKPNAFGLLFANAKGQPITSCYVRRDILHPIRERLGIPRGAFHAFRHGNATEMLRQGVNVRVVQQQLGHADLRMMPRYAHVVPQDQREAVERVTEVFLRRSAANQDAKALRVQ